MASKGGLFEEIELEKIVLCYVFVELYLHDQFILLYVIQKLNNLLLHTLRYLASTFKIGHLLLKYGIKRCGIFIIIYLT